MKVELLFRLESSRKSKLNCTTIDNVCNAHNIFCNPIADQQTIYWFQIVNKLFVKIHCSLITMCCENYFVLYFYSVTYNCFCIHFISSIFNSNDNQITKLILITRPFNVAFIISHLSTYNSRISNFQMSNYKVQMMMNDIIVNVLRYSHQ